MSDILPFYSRDYKAPSEWDPTRQRPAVALVREVNLSANGQRISVRLTRANRKVDVSTPAKLKALFSKIGSGTFDFPAGMDARPKLKFKSPMSLHNDGLAYIIYILKKKNWYFAHDYYPITISTASTVRAYFESSQIDSTGNAAQIDQNAVDPAIPISVPSAGMRRAAYVIADRNQHADPNNYVDNINLHVDLMFADQDGNPTLMPIIIDPDVRYPGGSGADA